MMLTPIDVRTAKQWLDQNSAVLLDVREFAEHEAQKIAGSVLKPLSSISVQHVPKTERKVILYCQSGLRSKNAGDKLLGEDSTLELYSIDGGIDAWQQAGFPLQRSGKKILPLDRQVQLTIGVAVLIFSLLGYFVQPPFIFGAAFFGAGLLNAGLTGWCGLGKAMARMPWNR